MLGDQGKEVTASPTELMRQAGDTASEYMRAGIREIDHFFGEGYAAGHPELLAAFMQIAARDYHSAQLNVAAQILAEGLRDALGSYTPEP
jgi:hypothetical protein